MEQLPEPRRRALSLAEIRRAWCKAYSQVSLAVRWLEGMVVRPG